MLTEPGATLSPFAEEVIGRKSLLNDVVIEMEDPRCKIAAIEVEDPRCKNLLVEWRLGWKILAARACTIAWRLRWKTLGARERRLRWKTPAARAGSRSGE